YTTFLDAGRAVHPSYVEGQMQGGTVQGIGWALNEEYFFTEDGTLVNGSFLDYRMPTPVDVPMIETVILEVPNPRHPFRLRGVGGGPRTHPAVGGSGQRHLSGGGCPHGPATDVARCHPGSLAAPADHQGNKGAAAWLSQSYCN